MLTHFCGEGKGAFLGGCSTYPGGFVRSPEG
jgi:hypothetical protein